MFGLFKKKSEKQTLEEAYQKLTKNLLIFRKQIEKLVIKKPMRQNR